MKVQNEMATKITVDTVQAAKSVSAFRNGTTALTNSWKANEMVYRTADDSLNALKSRYEGIGNVIELQKQKIDELKNRQEGLDRTNKDQANTWLKLEKDIQTATRQLASYEAQQKGLEDSLKNLNKQYEKQKKELDELVDKTNETTEKTIKASEAYKKQQIRLNETATAIAKAKSETKKLQDEMDKLNLRGIQRIVSFNDKLNEKIKSSRKKLIDYTVKFSTVLSGVTPIIKGIGAATEATKNVAKMQAEGKEMFVQYGVSQQKIADGGYSSSQALGSMKTMLQPV